MDIWQTNIPQLNSFPVMLVWRITFSSIKLHCCHIWLTDRGRHQEEIKKVMDSIWSRLFFSFCYLCILAHLFFEPIKYFIDNSQLSWRCRISFSQPYSLHQCFGFNRQENNWSGYIFSWILICYDTKITLRLKMWTVKSTLKCYWVK